MLVDLTADIGVGIWNLGMIDFHLKHEEAKTPEFWRQLGAWYVAMMFELCV